MSTLMNGYPGDRLLDFFLIVALGVALLSGAAWIVSWRLPRQPAIRHLVLVSALFCCLGMPLLASIFTASGWALIAIPLLPVETAGQDSDRLQVMAVDARFARAPQQPDELTLKRRVSPKMEALLGASPSGLDPSHPDPGRSRPGVPGVAAGSAGKLPEVPDLERGVNRAGWRAPYRDAATMVLVAWGCGSVLLLLRLRGTSGSSAGSDSRRAR